MPGYATKALAEFNHSSPKKRQDSSHAHALKRYVARIQYANNPVTSPLLEKEGKLYIQKANEKFLYLTRCVDSIILAALSSIVLQQSNPTQVTKRRMTQLLDYIATQENAITTYSVSNMVLAVHSSASYISKPNAQSRAGGRFFMSTNIVHPPNNSAVLNIAQIIKNVMSSVAEAELGELYIMAREAIHIRNILAELGHATVHVNPNRQHDSWGHYQQHSSTQANQIHGHALPLASQPRPQKTTPHLLALRKTQLRWLLHQASFADSPPQHTHTIYNAQTRAPSTLLRKIHGSGARHRHNKGNGKKKWNASNFDKTHSAHKGPD